MIRRKGLGRGEYFVSSARLRGDVAPRTNPDSDVDEAMARIAISYHHMGRRKRADADARGWKNATGDSSIAQCST